MSQVKVIHVFMDDVAISPPDGFLIRKGPGNCHFDFAQEILFVDFLQTPTEHTAAEDFQRWETLLLINNNLIIRFESLFS